MEKKKRLPKIIILTIVLASLSIVFLTISIVTSIINVKRTKDAINDIGTVKYDNDVEAKIDLAYEYYLKLDTNINLDKQVDNINVLNDAKYNYVRLALKDSVVSYNRRVTDNISEEVLSNKINKAYEKLKKYYKETEFDSIEGYKNDFKPLLDIYKKEEVKDNNSVPANSDTEEPEIC